MPRPTSDTEAPPDTDRSASGSPSAASSGDDPSARPSKTRLKQQMHDLQRLGQRLVDLPPGQLQRVELPERLRDQIDVARKVKTREATRRQMQYIGRLMRDIDVDAVRASLEAATGESDAAIGLMHRCERWRELLLDNDGALTRFLGEHRDADGQWLLAKIRAARRERDEQAPPRHQRELYRWLHDRLLES